MTALAQMALLGAVVLASNTKYNNHDLSGSLVQLTLAWLPSLVQGIVLGAAAASVYIILNDAGVLKRALAAPLSIPLAAAHFLSGAGLAIGSLATPTLMAVSSDSINAALLFYLAAPPIWLFYIASGYRLLVPSAALASSAQQGHALAICATITLTMIGWHYFERTQDTLAYSITDASVTIASWFSLVMGNPIHSIGVNEHGWPLYETGGITVSIAPVCAGIEGLFLTTTLLLTLVALERRRLHIPKAMALIALAAGLTFVVNALRLALLFYIGDHWSPEVAVTGFHSNFGVITLVVVSAAFTIAIRKFASKAPTGAAYHSPKPAVASAEHDLKLIVPQMVMIGCLLVFGLISGSFNWFYPASTIIVGGVVWRLKAGRVFSGWEATAVPALAGLFAFLVWIALVPADELASAKFQETLFGAPLVVSCAWLLFRLAGSAVLVPMVEEMAFRGFLLPWAAERLHLKVPRPIARASALLATSIVFGLVHSEVLAGIAAGLIYGAVQMHRSQYADAILAHSVTNSCLCLYALSAGEWSYL